MEEVKNNNIKESNGKEGIVIARIVKKHRKAKKNGEPFWILELSIGKSLTETYFKFTGKEEFTLKDNSKPMYVFTEKGRFINTLLEGNYYIFEFSKSHSGEYFYAEDWDKLGDNKRLIERAWRLLVDKAGEVKEEGDIEHLNGITNEELLKELEKRIKSDKIAVERDKVKFETPKDGENIELITDLKDKEGKFRLDLQEISNEGNK